MVQSCDDEWPKVWKSVSDLYNRCKLYFEIGFSDVKKVSKWRENNIH